MYLLVHPSSNKSFIRVVMTEPSESADSTATTLHNWLNHVGEQAGMSKRYAQATGKEFKSNNAKQGRKASFTEWSHKAFALHGMSCETTGLVVQMCPGQLISASQHCFAMFIVLPCRLLVCHCSHPEATRKPP